MLRLLVILLSLIRNNKSGDCLYNAEKKTPFGDD